MNKNFRAIDWKSYLPIPICEDHPEYGEFYEKAWELARDHVKEIDGMPQNPYMDEAFCATQLWIWDTCFMSLFCKFAGEVFPGVESFQNFYSVLYEGKLLPKALSADLVSVSGHKIHAPKGVGALIVSPDALRRRDLAPVLLGGGQEGGFRSGTENLIGIAGFAAAAEEGFSALGARVERMRELRDYAEEKLLALSLAVNRPMGARAPHILNVRLPDIRSETMLHELSRSGICISSGSACSSHAKAPSRALTAFGLSPEEITCSIRISLSHNNTKEEIDLLADAMSDALGRLVRIHH